MHGSCWKNKSMPTSAGSATCWGFERQISEKLLILLTMLAVSFLCFCFSHIPPPFDVCVCSCPDHIRLKNRPLNYQASCCLCRIKSCFISQQCLKRKAKSQIYINCTDPKQQTDPNPKQNKKNWSIRYLCNINELLWKSSGFQLSKGALVNSNAHNYVQIIIRSSGQTTT